MTSVIQLADFIQVFKDSPFRMLMSLSQIIFLLQIFSLNSFYTKIHKSLNILPLSTLKNIDYANSLERISGEKSTALPG